MVFEHMTQHILTDSS